MTEPLPSPPARRSLALRLLLWLVVGLLALGALIVGLAYALGQQARHADMMDRGQNFLRAAVSAAAVIDDPARLDHQIRALGPNVAFWLVLDDNRMVVVANDPAVRGRSLGHVADPLVRGAASAAFDRGPEGGAVVRPAAARTVLAHAARRWPSGDPAGVVVAVVDKTLAGAAVANLTRHEVLVLVGGLVLWALFAALLVLVLVVRPLNRVHRVAREAAAGETLPPLTTFDETDETGALGRTMLATFKALRQSEARFLDMTRNVPGVVYQYLVQPNGVIAFPWISDRVQDLFGLPASAVIADSSTLLNLVLAEDRQTVAAASQESYTHLTPFQCEFRMTPVPSVGGNGVPVWIQAHAIPRREPDGSVLWNGLLLDVSDRVAARQQLRESEQNLQTALENTGLGPWDWDVPSGRLRFGPQVETMLGYVPTNWETTMSFYDNLVHPDDLEAVRTVRQQHLAGLAPVMEVEYRFRRADGGWAWLQSRGRVVHRDDHGRSLRAIGTLRDVTERKRQEIRLRQLSEAVEQSPACVMITDTEGHIQYVNRCFEIVTGYPSAEVVGRTPRLLKSGQTPASTYKALWATLGRGETWTGEFLNRRRDGTLYWESAAISPIVDPDGSVRHYLGIKEDISERKQMEADLRRSNSELEQFAYAVSHDMREPLRTIASYLQLLERRYRDHVDDRGREFIHYAVDGAKRMEQQIQALLEYSRLGRQPHDLKRVPLGDVARDAGRSLAARLDERNAELIVDEGLPVVRGDADQLLRLFQNLIGNAVKCCPPDRQPLVMIRPLSPGPGGGVDVAVDDNGKGIPAERREDAFAIFRRLETPGGVEGTGVGLALCRRIAESHDGTLVIEDAPEGGARFHLHLPPHMVWTEG